MTVLLAAARAIDRLNGGIGRIAAWLLVISIFVSAGNAVLRKSFSLSSNAWLELQWYLFGAVFMLCAAWTLRDDEHVRVDALSQRFSPRTRVIVDLVCHLAFLMPFVVVMAYLSWPFVVTSFVTGEQSNNVGGLIRWPAKLWILLGFCLLVAQALSEIVKRSAMLTGHLPMPDDVGTDDDLPPAARNAGARSGE